MRVPGPSRFTVFAILQPVPQNGWFIWSGDFSADPDFFQPTCAHHIPAVLPAVLPYLALPQGWRFLIAPGHEDVWFDPTLLVAAP